MPDPRDYTDAFVKVSFQQDNDGDPASKQWYELGGLMSYDYACGRLTMMCTGSAKHQATEVTMCA